jgi:serine/threonine protein kinase/Tfp pilus assembly protein PilF
MTPEKWQKINDLFHAALAVDLPGRSEFIRVESGGDGEVVAEVSKLVSAYEESGNFIDQPVIPHAAKIISNGSGSAPTRETLATGEALGHYVVQERLGKGGMGEVYLCRDKSLNRDVAIKILLPEFTRDPDRVKRFQLEAKSASALNHPNIITIHEIGESEDLRFIATEFVKGRTLTECLKHENLSLTAVVKIAQQIASALNAAHEAGIVHRDIKPDNVMIRDDGIVKVLDFGLAKLAESPASRAEHATLLRLISVDSASPRTSPGMIMGTPDYMSPEQARGKTVDAQTDIFSFGVVLYQMLTGIRPFSGETISDVIAAVLTEEPQPVSEIVSGIPPELEEIVARSLKKEKNERYRTSRELLNDLTDLAEELQAQDRIERSLVPNRPESRTQVFQAATMEDDRSTAAGSSVGMPKRRAFTYVAGFAALLGAFAAILFAYQYISPSKQIGSIAVLPFVNESGDPEVEYLSDGMTDTLIRNLSQLPGLDVKARSSVFRYKGKEHNLKEIGAELNTQTILSGRFVQRGERLTLELELVDAATGNVMWKERYDRRQADLISLQTDLARDVSANLSAKITGAAVVRLSNNGTTNPEAYQLYLKGKYIARKGSEAGPQQSLKYFQDAVSLDPNFALGYAGLADSYALLGTLLRSTLPAEETIPKARAAAEKAIELDPDLSEAYTSLAWIKFRSDWDWAGAERDFKKAIELDPNNAQAHQWYGEFLSCMLRKDEAIAHMKRAIELEPFSVISTWNFGMILYSSRRFEEAIPEFKKALELDNTVLRVWLVLSSAYHQAGMESQSFETFLEYQKVLRSPAERVEQYKAIFKEKGMWAVLAMDLETAIKEQRFPITPYFEARYHAARRDRERTLERLEEAFRVRTTAMAALQNDVYLEFIRDDPRYKRLVQQMNFPQLSAK